MKLNFRDMAFLVDKLTKSEMWAIYLMGFDKEMPDQVSMADLVRIICVLCKRLDWIEVDPVESQLRGVSLCLYLCLSFTW